MTGMQSKTENEPLPQPSRNRPRFTIGALLLVTWIFAVIAAAAGYLFRGIQFDQSSIIIFFPFILIAPMGLAIVLSLLRLLIRWLVSRS